MFGNINQRQKQNEQATDKNVQAENQLEQKQPQVQPMGNEAANVNPFTQMIRMANLETGNEFLAGLEDEEDADEEIVLSKLFSAIDNRWLQTVFFNNKNADFKIDKAKNNISNGWRALVGDKTSKTGAVLDNLIKEVMHEDNLLPE